MIPSQMLKGILEGCILKIISSKDTYGYEISEELKKYGFSKISEGTIYPLLLRLEKNNFIVADYRDSLTGPKRKYFSITTLGSYELEKFFLSFQSMCCAVNELFKFGGNDYE
ncbi:MAG: PadR family transcriptional regulator [Filifactoraceae bacterium]